MEENEIEKREINLECPGANFNGEEDIEEQIEISINSIENIVSLSFTFRGLIIDTKIYNFKLVLLYTDQGR